MRFFDAHRFRLAALMGFALLAGACDAAEEVTQPQDRQEADYAEGVEALGEWGWSELLSGGMRVSPATATIAPGATVQLRGTTASGETLTGLRLRWASSDPRVATVSSSGLVTGVSAGTAAITASFYTLSARSTITVSGSGTGTGTGTGSSVPGQVTTLAAAATTSSSVTLRWTAVGDGAGGAANYALRVWAPVMDWGAAAQGEKLIPGSAPGTVMSYTYTGLPASTAVQFQMVAYRGEGATAVYGPLSNVVSATTASTSGSTSLGATASALAGDRQVSLAGSVTGGSAPHSYQWHGGTTDPGSSPSSATALAGMTSLSATHTGVSNGSTYYYRLVVTDGSGARAVSNVTSATPAAPTSSGSGNYPNRPADLTLIGRFDGSVKESGGHAFGLADFGAWRQDPSAPASQIQVVSDASNPSGSGRSLRFTWNQAYNPRSGSATANSFSGGPYRELYIMQRIFLESGGWSGFGNKYFYIGAASGARHNSGSPTQYYNTRESDGRLRFITQNGTTSVLVNSATSAPMGNNSTPLVTGRWLNIEYRFVSQSSSSAADGQVHVWVNGVLVGSNTGVRWVSAGDPIGFNGMEWYGDANTVTSVSYYRLGELYIAGRR